MAVGEKERHELMKAVEEVLGAAHAETLMNLLPPVGWADVATKQDLRDLRTATKADIEHLRTATKADIEHLRTATKADIEHLRTATKADIEQLRVSTKADIEQLRVSTKAEIEHLRQFVDERFERERAERRGDLEHGLRQQLLTFLSANTVLLGIVVTIVQLLG